MAILFHGSRVLAVLWNIRGCSLLFVEISAAAADWRWKTDVDGAWIRHWKTLSAWSNSIFHSASFASHPMRRLKAHILLLLFFCTEHLWALPPGLSVHSSLCLCCNIICLFFLLKINIHCASPALHKTSYFVISIFSPNIKLIDFRMFLLVHCVIHFFLACIVCRALLTFACHLVETVRLLDLSST